MNSRPPRKLRCAVYTRKSSEDGLDQEFNSLHAQREAAVAYVASQKSEGWIALPDHYDDGGISGGTLERPALKRLVRDVEAGLIDVVVVYKIDRLSRSLTDFAKLVDVFERHNVTFVSVTQQFNTTTSMGRLVPRSALPRTGIRAMIIAASSGISDKEGAMCWRSEYDLYTRTSSKPANSKPARSLVEVLRDLFRPRRAQGEQADVVPFRAEVASRTDKEVEREGSKAA